ncbi:MAG: Hsp33 family molecular chaperone HslO [Firmicutes bacterium]|nr:Hsp33 family molecular chaperone HslO [Bacillota bacterium]
MQDYIIRATAGNGSVRIFAANTRNLVNKAAQLHKTTPVAAAALGRTLTAAAMMGATLKDDTDILTVDIRGSGPLGGIVVVVDNKSCVKGYVFNPGAEIANKAKGKLDVGGAVGIGVLTVTKDMGLKEPVSGQVELVSGEIAEDLTYYFAASEQTPSSVALGVLVDVDYSVKQAGGYIIQLMPDAKEEIISHLETILPTLSPVTALLEEGKSVEDILHMIFAQYGLQVLETIHPKISCNCSREKTEKALISLGPDELRNILKEDKGANLHCHFCNTDYAYGEEEIKSLLDNGGFYGR